MSNLDFIPHRGSGASRFGWHFLSAWSKCETYFWRRHLEPHPSGGFGIEPRGERIEFVLGRAFHTGLELWRRSWLTEGTPNLELSLEGARKVLTASWPTPEGPDADFSDKWTKGRATLDRMLPRFHATYGPDGVKPDTSYVPLFDSEGEPTIEYELSIDVGFEGYVYTARLDFIGEREGYLWALEYKTTAASGLSGLRQRIELDGQFTGQNWLLHDALVSKVPSAAGIPIAGVTLCAIVKDRAAKSTDPDLVRDTTSRTEPQLEKFRVDVARKLDRIENSVGNYRQLLERGATPEAAGLLAFDGSPDGYTCRGPFGKCEFFDLCANREQTGELLQLQFEPRVTDEREHNPFAPAPAPTPTVEEPTNA